jgi:aminoglycoside phosphotransferase (APT) family kinase protein
MVTPTNYHVPNRLASTGTHPDRRVTLRRMPDGIDEARVTTWFEEHVPTAATPLRFGLIAGGRSNLTFRVDDADGQSFVLRRPPLGHVLESAHDVGREHRIIAALHHHGGVPVPAALGLCDDPEVNGAPFMVMSFVDGSVVRDHATAEAIGADARHQAAVSMVEVLAGLHALDPDEAGLGELGRREAYVERQLNRWHRQFGQTKQREIPAVDEAHRRLLAVVPTQQRASIVHGDYRIDNTVLDPDGNVIAVLDWELCTLGDPLADLGQLAVYWTQPGDPVPELLGAPIAAGDFPSRDELVAAYAAASPLDLSDLQTYMAFGYWKLACILEGVYARYLGGSGGGDDSDPAAYATQVPLLAEAAVALLPPVPA